MNILIKDIPEEGLQLKFKSPEEGWFRQVLTDALEDFHHKTDKAECEFQLYRTGEHVDCSGLVRTASHPACCRCLKVFSLPITVPIHLTLAPLFENTRELKNQEKEDLELVKEDLEFAYYEGSSFNLGDLIREQVILAIPMQPLCAEDCKGLCQTCGKNLNEEDCGCPPNEPRKSRLTLRPS